MGAPLQAFGRSYSLLGSSDTDLILKTRGQVKIQWGKKFIDLIKDGKINVDTKFIYLLDTIGQKDGIYVIEDLVWLVVGGLPPINLVGEVGNTYVSFLGPQETTPEQKYIAMTNIGFLYENLLSIDEKALQNGIIYVELEKKLYTITNGVLSEFKVSLPNPFTELFIIMKDSDEKGALVIKGFGINNSVAFDGMYLYSEEGGAVINFDTNLFIRSGNQNVAVLSQSIVEFLSTVVLRTLKSSNYTSNSGYKLYIDTDGTSILEIDKIIVRLGITDIDILYPEYWLGQNNIISRVEDSIVYLSQNNTFSVGDTLITYIKSQEDEDIVYIPEELKVISILDSSIEVDKELGNSSVGLYIYKISSKDKSFAPIRLKGNTVDIISEKHTHSRFGDLLGLDLKYSDSGQEKPIEDNYGVYSKFGVFETLAYLSTYALDPEDNSSKMASTEWVNLKLKTTLSNIDLFYPYNEVTFESLSLWIYNTGLIEKILESKTTIIVGIRGFATLLKTSSGINCSAIVSALLDNTLSYRSIHFTVQNTAPLTIHSISSYIIKEQFIPGYYWSNELEKGIPINPQYIGTTSDGFLVSENKKILWYSNDGKKWDIIKIYIEEVLTRLYVISTHSSSHLINGRLTYWPSGFIGYSEKGLSISNYGKSNFIPISYENTDISNLDLSILESAALKADVGVIPEIEGFLYLWSIEKDANKSDPSNWNRELVTNGISGFTNVVESCDWGNYSNPPGYTLRYIDPDTHIIGAIPDSSIYLESHGSRQRWSDPIWRKSFLRLALRDILKANRHKYTKTVGWTFNFDGIISARGFGGQLSSRIGGASIPTSDNPLDIGYKLLGNLGDVCGYVLGEGVVVHFCFENVKVGNILPYAYVLGSAKEGQLENWPNYLYDVEYSAYRISLTEIPSNSIVTS